MYHLPVNCRYCGVDIADNALICYRCGHATSEPRIKPPDRRRRRPAGTLPSVVALLLLVIAALFLGSVAHEQTPRYVSWAVGVLATILAVWRLMRARSR
ncbi:MAG: hypothetical protein KGN76_09160 [Acidobacteriota bacterium]|nr:hypothetical protein [Acidobacteriota bacterium]